MTYNTTNHVSDALPLVVIGAGGHAISVASVALSAGLELMHFVDKDKKGEVILGISVIGGIDELADLSRCCFGIAVGDNAARERIYLNLIAQYPTLRFPPLIHSSATVSSFTSIGEGVVAMPNAVIGPNSRVGKFCLVNTQASIDHDCVMHDFSSLAPAAVTGGRVIIGKRSAICIGATVKHGLTIGDDCVIGANSYLNRDLPSNQVAYGIPARQVRSCKIGDPYLD